MTTSATFSGRSSVYVLWSFLTLAAAGFALVAAGIYLDSHRGVAIGTAATAFGALAFLFVQFWRTGVAPPLAIPVAHAASRPMNFNYADATSLTPATSLQPVMEPEQELVEFELVTEPRAPTELRVPAAFEMVSNVSAAPPEPSLTVNDLRTGEDGFVPAIERRREIVQGLPLLSQIFSQDPPPAVQVTPMRAGKTKGQCSSCGTMLWAPTQRPLRLRCPKCGHVRTLTE